MIYYVYSHTNLKNNEIFYVGMGQLKRVKMKSREKDSPYNKYRKNHELTTKDIIINIFGEFDNKKDACYIEDIFIEKYKTTLVNYGTNKEQKFLARSNSAKLMREQKRGVFALTKEELSNRWKIIGNSENNIRHCKTLAKRNEKPIICTTDNKRFDSINEAIKYYGLHGSNISNVLSGRYRHTGGKSFCYA